MTVVLSKLNKLRYIQQDIQNQVSAEIYIAKALHHAAACNQNEFSVLLTAWQEINMKMWIHIAQSITATTKHKFVKTMKDQKFNWKSMFSSLSQASRLQARLSYNARSFYNFCLTAALLQARDWFSQEYNNY